MTKLFTLFTLYLFVVSCSNDKDPDTNQVQSPTIDNISVNTANIGDIITINGQNFNRDEDYLVLFNDLEGTVIEITSLYIKVKIPLGATSGSVILTYNDNILNIGNIIINTSKLYAYEFDYSTSLNQIVEINKVDGATKLIASLDARSYWNIVFDSSSSQIIGINENWDSNSSYLFSSLLLININDGTSSIIKLEQTTENSQFIDLVLVNNNKLYAYEVDVLTGLKQIVEINKIDGSTKLIASLNVENNLNLVFDISSNQVIGMNEYQNSNNSYSQSLLLINLNDATSSTVNLEHASENSMFKQLVIGKDNKLYAYEEEYPGDLKQIVEINKANGTTKLIASLNVENDWDLVFDKAENKFIGLNEYKNPDNSFSQSLLLINLSKGTSSTIDLEHKNVGSLFTGLVIK